MPETTSPDNLPFPLEDDGFDVFADLEDLAAATQAALSVLRTALGVNQTKALAAAAAAQSRADDAFKGATARIYVSSSDPVIVGSGSAWRAASMTTQYASDAMRRSVSTDPNARSKIRLNRSGPVLAVARSVWSSPQAGATPAGIREAFIGLNGDSDSSRAIDISGNTRGDVATQGTMAYARPALHAIIPGSAGDELELFVRQTQGSNVELSAGSGAGSGLAGTYLAVFWLGPLP